MSSAEEDHDHDLPRHTRCRRGYYHRWILRPVNTRSRKVQRRQRRTSGIVYLSLKCAGSSRTHAYRPDNKHTGQTIKKSIASSGHR
ncbi:hypothetical protein KPH14_006610 [Odynerus spinipes]|uniref:Uncharacterized protein n=1 Tax=Odynerus spinipes TaxID=1348599 RepID=A0AAD9RQR0_9HYME|nr:hypothetical protein KPH14_006610 [Odynerus spinipes]